MKYMERVKIQRGLVGRLISYMDDRHAADRRGLSEGEEREEERGGHDSFIKGRAGFRLIYIIVFVSTLSSERKSELKSLLRDWKHMKGVE